MRKRFSGRIDIEWFPAYAPELNPVEQVWNHSKYSELANYIPDDVFALEKAVCKFVKHIRSQKTLLRSFFEKAGLKVWFVPLVMKRSICMENLTHRHFAGPWFHHYSCVLLFANFYDFGHFFAFRIES